MDTSEVTSIHEDFYTFYKKYKKLDDVTSSGDKAIIECIELLHLLEKRAAKEMLFSSGETIEDVYTTSLKFGLISHYLSELYTIKNPPNRTRWLRLSDMYAKEFINQCQNWNILSEEDLKIFDRGFGDDCQEKLDPYAARTELVKRYRMDKECDEILEKLSSDKSYFDVSEVSKETHWKLFREEEMEREFWLTLFQKAVRQSLHTLKQNAEEKPLAQMSEEMEKRQAVATEEQKFMAGKQESTDTKSTSDNVMGSKVDIEQRAFERYRLHLENRGDQQDKTEKSKGPPITVINSHGQMKRFDNLDAYEKHGLDKRIDNIVQMRTNRNEVFKDANPWTYTAEEAAQLGLLPEIPKDYEQKSKDKKMVKYWQKNYGHRCPHQVADDDGDDGSQLKVGEVEYQMRGDIKTFTMDDMPPEEEKDPTEMADEEYENWIQETRGMENWKDDHERGVGNPYFR